jgi:citrate lyase subunit beta / citryl-CoA lyase
VTWRAGLVPGPAWLFCPADRPERYAKAAAVADVVILDLEDAVAPPDKPAARDAVIANALDPDKTVIRVNAAGTHEHELDLTMLARTGYTCVMLPKCESAHHVIALAPRMVVALIESPTGVLKVGQSAAARNAVGVMWGAEDLVAGLGGKSSRRPDGSYRDIARHVRSATLLAAKAHGRFALDSVYLDIEDSDGLREEADDAVASGFNAKVAIHPKQVGVIREAYAPTDAEVLWAGRVLEAAATRRGVFAFEGRMIDSPILKQAETILSLVAPTR